MDEDIQNGAVSSTTVGTRSQVTRDDDLSTLVSSNHNTDPNIDTTKLNMSLTSPAKSLKSSYGSEGAFTIPSDEKVASQAASPSLLQQPGMEYLGKHPFNMTSSCSFLSPNRNDAHPSMHQNSILNISTVLNGTSRVCIRRSALDHATGLVVDENPKILPNLTEDNRFVPRTERDRKTNEDDATFAIATEGSSNLTNLEDESFNLSLLDSDEEFEASVKDTTTIANDQNANIIQVVSDGEVRVVVPPTKCPRLEDATKSNMDQSPIIPTNIRHGSGLVLTTHSNNEDIQNGAVSSTTVGTNSQVTQDDKLSNLASSDHNTDPNINTSKLNMSLTSPAKPLKSSSGSEGAFTFSSDEKVSSQDASRSLLQQPGTEYIQYGV
jgi:hypothetical protein